MSLLFASFGAVFGLVALLIIGASGFTAESFALAVIVMVVGLLMSLFVMDSLRPSERAKSRRAKFRKARKHLEKHGWKWALGLTATAALLLYLGKSQDTGNPPQLGSPPTPAPILASAMPPDTERPQAEQPALLHSEVTASKASVSGTVSTPAAPAAETPTHPSPLVDTVAPTPQAPTANDAANEVAAAIESWRQAWETRDITTYLDAYDPAFKPTGGLTLAAWQAQRRDRVGRARDIHIVLEMREVTVKGDQAIARFRQWYNAAHITDSMRKQLLLTRTDGSWRIVEEKEDSAS